MAHPLSEFELLPLAVEVTEQLKVPSTASEGRLIGALLTAHMAMPASLAPSLSERERQ